jgi:RHH-type proline utilization regulon transcriptional repressor/proline dehydrogenase/delta 1-pyrroline-5-carboxylate dehydrogenase
MASTNTDDRTVFDFLSPTFDTQSPLRAAVDSDYHRNEEDWVLELLDKARFDPDASQRVNQRARWLVSEVRARKDEQGVLEAFMQEYDLSSEEGVVLMCLAEALLRIPDDDTAEKLIADKLGEGNWESHLGKSSSILVNASTWGLMLTGKLVRLSENTQRSVGDALRRLVNKSGEPVIRSAIRQAMRIMGHQYVMGRTIEDAMERAAKKRNADFRYTYDMLGEAALTSEDAERYFESYKSAIRALAGRKRAPGEDIYSAPSISVKLSALHPRFEYTQQKRVLEELTPRVLELAKLARAAEMALTIDSEEADRLMLLMDVFRAVFYSPELGNWQGLGLAVQSYLKRGMAVLDWLAEDARQLGKRIPVRLVKGAYWDTEVKHAQVEGYEDYPVFTRKPNTDVSFIACARKLLSDRAAFYPQFATHNAHTISAITEMAGDRLDFEFQRLHGMGEDLYGVVLESEQFHHACRVYAPVGCHEDLLPYLVRRLLENGANTSFVNRISDVSLPVEEVAGNPIASVTETRPVAHPAIPLPRNLYGEARLNSKGINLANDSEMRLLAESMQPFATASWAVEPLVAEPGKKRKGAETIQNINPAKLTDVIGEVSWATAEEVDAAISLARDKAEAWDEVPAAERAAMLDKTADLMEQSIPELMALCAREAGKTVHDAVAEIREAVDFCRYYASEARRLFAEPQVLPGPTGEHNELSLHGRGVFVCISPWNFPLAIFMGQVTAALAAGNTVLAKPAEQTPAIAARGVELLHQAGVPKRALQLLPGDGATVGARLTADPRIAGVAFTGSTETARLINHSLAGRDAPLAVLIAETGGQNAMLVDSSALPEQVVKDVIGSAVLSAGQRCSALRVLYLQVDIADRVIEMLAGAFKELVVGDPAFLASDIGPVIDQDALSILENHAMKMESRAKLIARAHVPEELDGHFFAPCAFEIDSIKDLEREVFGPILHVVRYRARDLDAVIDDINATGYGLTLGVHSRIDSTQLHVANSIRCGNRYVNRTMTGAVVGVQPFGGEGLSGTGPKAGGPHYMLRFATERTLTINTAAVGGNASLMSLDD